MIDRKEINPESTLVFIDDHLHAFKRIAGVMKFGIRHVVVEDNYKVKEGKKFNCLDDFMSSEIFSHFRMNNFCLQVQQTMTKSAGQNKCFMENDTKRKAIGYLQMLIPMLNFLL